jgi:hypothetical protein
MLLRGRFMTAFKGVTDGSTDEEMQSCFKRRRNAIWFAPS